MKDKNKTKKAKSTKIKFGSTIDPVLQKIINKKHKENGWPVTFQLHEAFKLLYPEYKG